MFRDPQNAESRFIHNILSPSAGNLLEIGCGDGRLTGELLSISNTILALDPDAESIQKARHLLEEGVNLILGSGESVPLPDCSVDTVVFSLSLHHHPDPGNALTEAQRVLMEGGRILVLEPEAEGPTNRLFRLIHNEDEAYDKTAKAIDNSVLTMTAKGCYETTWSFEDFDEMVRYLFDYFEKEPDSRTTESMGLLLGDQRNSKPLDMMDVTRFWLLQADPGSNQGQVE